MLASVLLSYLPRIHQPLENDARFLVYHNRFVKEPGGLARLWPPISLQAPGPAPGLSNIRPLPTDYQRHGFTATKRDTKFSNLSPRLPSRRLPGAGGFRAVQFPQLLSGPFMGRIDCQHHL